MRGTRVLRWLRRRWHGLDAASERWLPDRLIYARRYRRNFGRRLDLREPRTFNEKLYWLMLHYRLPIVTALADKYEARRYVAERIGEKYLNEIYGVWDDPDAIDFDRLPATFVLKIAGGWNMNIFCGDRARFDTIAARTQLRAWLRRPHYLLHREWAYKGIRPRIMAERLLIDARWSEPPDFKVHCFNGEPRFVGVHLDRARGHRRDFFDLEWRLLPFTKLSNPPSGEPLAKPPNFDEIVACARRLADGFPFIRVDFLSANDQTFFGEFTWYPAAAQNRFWPESYDRYWGDAIRLPSRQSLDALVAGSAESR
jgi:hypothetical protein